MKRTAPTLSGAYKTQHPRIGVQSKLAQVAIPLVAALICTAAAPAMAFQYPKYLKISQTIAAPIAAQNLCQTYVWACSKSVGSAAITHADLETLAQVNRRVNHGIREVSDLSQFRTNDVWTLPTSAGGDCEDFALLKKQELIARGLPAQSLLIATVLDRNRRGHAVLIARTERGDLVLDNVTGKIRNWARTGYIFLRMQNPNAPERWVSLAMAN